eukprot:CAMPEP_0172213704 /NCGR_PEP_ID=MMETSP1050-20130122/37741_1 /TAXON_ID=233186 /ORGANISM="Cryptomonas curvata, Strain CCAP979/52" /LENGTH=635 /DNA_ID=CAMNT_0012894567 /DNA_START=2385 /DNA_END=4289 /DNA_ORIENTATION=+
MNCSLCAEGTFSTVLGAASNETCISCGPGTYQSGKGAVVRHSCTDCSSGTYQDWTGMSSCMLCRSGTFQTGQGMTNEGNCTLCRAGKYQTGQGMALEASCTLCLAGTYQTGFGMTNSNRCNACSICTGALSLVGSDCTSIADTVCAVCRACPAGKYKISGCVGKLEAKCELCGPGTYSTGLGAQNSSECLRCPAGTYQTGQGLSDSSSCFLCRAGTFQANEGMPSPTSCLECSAGKYQSGIGITGWEQCISCGKGTYQTGMGMMDIQNCTICPKGKYHIDFSAVDITSCKDFTIPSSDVHLSYTENEMNNGQLTWVSPSNTGLGDKTSVRITQYNLMVSSCISSLVMPNCSTWMDQVVSSRDNVSITEFRYPVSYNISFDLSEGYLYYFHVTPQNVLGPSRSPETIKQQFGRISGAPAFDYVSGTGASIAASRGKLQVWLNGNISELVKIRIVNIPVVRDEDIVGVTFSVGNWSHSKAANVTSSYIRFGTTIVFRPPYLPTDIFHSCDPITVAAVISFKISFFEVGSLQYLLTYFCYSKPLLSSVVPTRGSVGGGTILALNVIDPPGALTRQGANLPNFQEVFTQQRRIQILFFSSSKNYSAAATVLSASASQDGLNAVRISARTPALDTPDMTR